jgi:hypothetical protein
MMRGVMQFLFMGSVSLLKGYSLHIINNKMSNLILALVGDP